MYGSAAGHFLSLFRDRDCFFSLPPRTPSLSRGWKITVLPPLCGSGPATVYFRFYVWKKQKKMICATIQKKNNDNDNNEMWQIKKQIIIWTKVAEMLIKKIIKKGARRFIFRWRTKTGRKSIPPLPTLLARTFSRLHCRPSALVSWFINEKQRRW